MTDNPPIVSYEVKEVLDRMDDRLERIERKLDQKADKAEVAELSGRVAVLEVERATRETAREVKVEHQQKAALSAANRWGLILGAASSAGVVVEAALQLISHAH